MARSASRLRSPGLARLSKACRVAGATLTTVFRDRLFGQRLIERKVNDYRLLLDARDPGIHRSLLRHGTRELEQRYLLERTLRPGMRVLDLGANIGYYTVMMSKLVGERGRVYAVEPHPENFDLLEQNIRLNRLANVEAEQVAIDVCDGKRTLLVSDHCNWHSFHDPAVRASEAWADVYERRMPGRIVVETRNLASFLADKPPLDLLRMDLEGYEVEILDALAELPRAVTQNLRVLMEAHPEFYDPARHDMRRVLEKLRASHGYQATFVVSDFYDGARGSAHTQAGRDVFARYGYGSSHILDPSHRRPIYVGISMAHAIDLICTSENVHAVMLEPMS